VGESLTPPDPGTDVVIVDVVLVVPDADDRAAYERTKRELAQRTWATVMDYAAAKSDVVGEILGRARPDLVPPGG
jgi:GrpB-like predicted nucleotidyltransferase (UPF0157 family)